jgi:peptide/nickel transport system substrate-binding protein/oligopeptide transport system substrate-binding protein
MRKAYLITILLLGLLVSGCGRGTREYPDYMRLRLKDDPTSLDPARIVDVPGGALSAKIYDGLVRFNGEGKIVSGLASRWEVSADGRTYYFYLRPGVRFHNGREVVASDFVYSLKRLLDPRVNSPRNWLLQAVRGAERFSRGEAKEVAGLRRRGNREVVIELERPSSLFLDFLAMPNTVVVPREEVEKWGSSFSDHPCGTGPFRLVEWVHNNRIVLRADPGYFGGKTHLAGIIYRVIPEDMTATVEFEQGGLDLLAVPRSEFKKYTTRSPWKERVTDRVGLNIYYLGFNCQKPPFDDPRLRRAFNCAGKTSLID